MNKEFKSFLKLPGGSEITNCYYPFKLDTYGCGCSNNCLYCYARSVLHFRGLWDEENPSVADIDKIDTIFKNHFDKNKVGRFSPLLKHRVPIHLGGMTDCFSDVEKINGVTYKLLKILDRYHYPYLILTKNKLIEEYTDVLNKDLAYIQFTITTPFDDVSKTFEEGASLTSERFAACKNLSDFYTAVRINPMFPMYKDGHYSKGIESKKFRYFDWSLIDMCKDASVNTIIAGFLRLSSWNIKWILERTGENLFWLFNGDTKVKNQALHFSIEEKRYYYETAKKLCDEKQIDFSVCYDSDDAYEEFRYLWANQNDCCNGLHKIKGFTSNYKAFRPNPALEG